MNSVPIFMQAHWPTIRNALAVAPQIGSQPWHSWEISWPGESPEPRRADNQLLRHRGHTTATATAWTSKPENLGFYHCFYHENPWNIGCSCKWSLRKIQWLLVALGRLRGLEWPRFRRTFLAFLPVDSLVIIRLWLWVIVMNNRCSGLWIIIIIIIIIITQSQSIMMVYHNHSYS